MDREYRSVLEDAPLLALWLGPEHVLVHANRRARSCLGAESSGPATTGAPLWRAEASLPNQWLRAAADGLELAESELCLSCGDGRQLRLRARGIALKDPKTPLLCLGWAQTGAADAPAAGAPGAAESVDALPLPTWASDAEGARVHFNRTWLQWTGRTLESQRGIGWLEGVHPDDRAECAAALQRALEQRQPFEIEYRLLLRERGYRWIRDSGAPREAGDGSPLGFAGCCVDVTEYRRGEHHFQQLFEHLPIAEVVVDQSGAVQMVNPQAEALFGYRRGELIGQSVDVLVPVRLRAAHMLTRKAYAQQPIARPMGAGRELFGLRKDGTEVPVEIGLSPLESAEGTLILAAIIDISERKRAEHSFERLFEHSPLAKIVVDREGLVLMMNPPAERLFGYARNQLIGQSVERLVPERLRAAHALTRAAFTRQPVARPMGAGRDLFGLRADGSEVPIEIGLSTLDSAQGTVILAAIVDITERKRTEEALRSSLAEKELLLREIHHRVKNNLQVVSSLLNLRTRATSDEQARAALLDSRDRIHAMALVHERMYRSERMVQLEADEHVREVATELFRAYAPTGGRIALLVEVEKLGLGLEHAVPFGLILNELIANALKHAFPAERPGRLRVHLGQPDAAHIELMVEDDGVGLPPGVGLDSATGMGMRLVSLLAQQIGARATLERSPGTRVRVVIPIHGTKSGEGRGA